MEIHVKGSSTSSVIDSKTGFIKAISLIVALIVIAIIGQNIAELSTGAYFEIFISILSLGLFVGLFYKSLNRILHTPYVAISSLLSIAAGTAIGTFITQNALPENFQLRYGDNGSNILEFLQFNDVFHSWWYVSIFILMGASLIKISWRKGFHNDKWGFHLAHISPIIILIGFWIDYFQGFRGIIPLEVDEITNEAKVYDKHTNFTKGRAILPFNIRLDNFEFEKHDPDYRIQIWKNESSKVSGPNGSISNQMKPNIKASFPLKTKKTRKIYGTDVRFWILDFYPNFTFDYSYPEDIDTISPDVPGVLLDIVTSAGEATLNLRDNDKGQNILSDPMLGASLEFYWDPPDDVFTPLINENFDSTSVGSVHSPHTGRNNWAEMGRIIFSGIDRKIYFATKEGVVEYYMEKGKFFPMPGKEGTGFTFRFLYPAIGHLKSFPATKNDDLENPVARIQVWSESINPAQTVFIYPGMNIRGGTYVVPGTDYLIALESFKEMETKYWKSDLTILDKDGNKLKNQSIKVNEPLLFSGYRFYQSDYDPENPAYSGIGITYTPGLYTVYFGFILMVLGTLMLFYWHTQTSKSTII